MSVAPFPDEGRGPSPTKIAQAERVDHLAQVPLFADCSKRQLRAIARSTRHEVFESDQEMITEGSPSREAFIIIAGELVVRRRGRKLAELGPGDIVGELGLLVDRPRRASVRTSTPVECLALDQTALHQAIRTVPELGWTLLQTVAARLADP